MTTTTHAQDIKTLDKNIGDLAALVKRLAVADEFDELRLIIHRPGWTTPAEHLLVQGALDALRAQIDGFVALKGALLDASRQVGK